MESSQKIQEIFNAPFGIQSLIRDTKVIKRQGWYQLISPSIPELEANEIIFSQCGDDEVENLVHASTSQYHSRGLPIKWCITPFTKPSNLDSFLDQADFYSWEYRGMGMDVKDYSHRVPKRIEVQSVTDEIVEDYLDVLLAGLEISSKQREIAKESLDYSRNKCPLRWFHYVAYLDKKPVGTSAFVLKENSAYFSGGLVLKEFRGKGIYRALLSARVKEVERQSVSFITTQVRETTSAPILEKLGWKTFYKLPIFAKKCD